MGLLAVLSLYCVGALAIEGLSQVPPLNIPQAGSASLGVDFSWGPTRTSDTARLTSITATDTATITANTVTVTTGGNAHNSILSTVGGSGKTGSFTHPASITTMSWQPVLLSLTGTASGIQGLEDALIHQQEQSHSDLLLIEGRLHERSVQHQEEVTVKTETINELESQLRRGRLEVDVEDTGPEAKVPKRAGRKWKRTRGKGRACKGVSTEEAVGKQSLSDPLESSGETFVETFKEEVVQ